MNFTPIRCILFDFADTLCSVPYFTGISPEVLEIVRTVIFGSGKAQWADPWMRGDLTSVEIADYLARRTGVAPEVLLAQCEQNCARLPLNPAIWRFAQAQRGQGRLTALVTVNADVFSRVVVPALRLAEVFDVVVNSADHHVTEKLALCEIAFRRLNGCDFSNSLLIDDHPENVAAFRARGGQAYCYTTDETFAEWADNGEQFLANNRLTS